MADEKQTKEILIRYWGLTDGKTTDRWLLSEFDHETLLDTLESREKDVDRLVRLPGDRGVLGRIHTRSADGNRTLKLYKVEPAGVLSLLRGEEVEEYDPGEDASLMYPSWMRFHSGNRVGILKGPGGAGKGDLTEFLNKLEPPLLEDVPRRRGGSQIGLTALLSNADRAAIATTARRVNGLSLSLPADEEVHVDHSVVSEAIEFLKTRLGRAVSLRLEVTASRNVDGAAQVANNLQQEVGRIVQSDDLSHFRSARMSYDREDRHDLDLDLLAEVVTARVAVVLGPRGSLTDGYCSQALTQAWEEVEDRLPWAVADDEGQDGGDEHERHTAEG